MSTSFCLELFKPSAREVEVQQNFLSSDAVSSLRALFSSPSSPAPPHHSSLSTRVQKINTSLADSSIGSELELVQVLYLTWSIYHISKFSILINFNMVSLHYKFLYFPLLVIIYVKNHLNISLFQQ